MQQVSHAPLPCCSNHFSILEIDNVSKISQGKMSDEDAQLKSPIPPHALCCLKWEKQMHPKLVINSLEPTPTCIHIPIHLKTTDTMEEARTKAMVDSGLLATSSMRNMSCVLVFQCTT